MSVYKNGNTIVEIQKDGTKIRYVPDGVPALPIYPESIDMKITNCCEMACPMCHEQSTANGKHGDLFCKLVDSLHPYTEVAIGGGDPLSHPNLIEFLEKLKKKDVIANITVHWKSFMQNRSLLHDLTDQGLIHGLGISINEIVSKEVIEEIMKFPLAVVHTIIGISGVSILEQFKDKDLNILLLGYKTFGRGLQYRTQHGDMITKECEYLRKNIKELFRHFRAVSFDNLAIEQIQLKSIINPDVYSQIYMGGDGTFTMYVDLVENKYAVSSTSKRYKINSDNIDELFKSVRNLSKDI